MMCAILRMSFYFVLFAVSIQYLDMEFLNKRESSNSYPFTYLLTWSSLISFWSSLSFTLVRHLYPMSKLFNELNIMKLKLYVHIIPSSGFTLGLETEIFWSLTITILVIQAIHEWLVEGTELSHANTLSWKSFVIVSPHQNIIFQNCWHWTRKTT